MPPTRVGVSNSPQYVATRKLSHVKPPPRALSSPELGLDSPEPTPALLLGGT